MANEIEASDFERLPIQQVSSWIAGSLKRGESERLIVRATASLKELSLEEIQKVYFEIGTDPEGLNKLTFAGMLTVVCVVQQALREDTGSVQKVQIHPNFSEREQLLILHDLDAQGILKLPFDDASAEWRVRPIIKPPNPSRN